jgi:GNAT superfamily N-acetyltransferase
VALAGVSLSLTALSDELVELRNGTRALIRAIGPHDRDRLREGFEQASDESIYLRFLGPHPRLTNRELDYLTAVDHVHHEALIAVDPETGQSFGTARYVRDTEHPESAEFAVGVGDRWMRIGLGTALLSALALRAREAGIVRFTGVISAENHAITGLVRKVLGPYRTASTSDGAAEIVVDVEPPPST